MGVLYIPNSAPDATPSITGRYVSYYVLILSVHTAESPRVSRGKVPARLISDRERYKLRGPGNYLCFLSLLIDSPLIQG